MKNIKAVVFDWAGTMIDFGSFAPMGVFVDTFAEFGIDVTIQEAREPMGMAKWDHIESMLNMPRVSKAWCDKYGHSPTRSDVSKLYDIFIPMNERVVAKYATLIPGAKETADYLTRSGIKIGSTTGYTRSIMKHVLPIAAEQGYEPENLVCSDDLEETRPGPLGMYKCFTDLAVYPPESVIKVDDTVPGIAEGVAAGCVTVGVLLTGNYAGLTSDELSSCRDDELDKIRVRAGNKLKEAGADYLIDTVAELPKLIGSI